jgi:hypothetical protein
LLQAAECPTGAIVPDGAVGDKLHLPNRVLILVARRRAKGAVMKGTAIPGTNRRTRPWAFQTS